MKFEFDNSPMSFNPKRGGYYAVAIAFLFLLISFYISFNKYRTYVPHEVEVNYHKYKSGNEERNINNGILRTRPKTTFVIKSKNYFQYFILELSPSSKKNSLLFFSINYFLISIIIAVSSRKSSKEKIFTKELLSGLNFLIAYILVMMFSKIALESYTYDYIEQLSNNEVRVTQDSSSFEIVYFHGSIMLLVVFITYIKKGIELQMEKDLTI